MNNINSIDIKKIITDSTSNLFATMLSMNLEESVENQLVHETDKHFTGCVSFNGALVNGLLEICITEEFGRIIAARMLDLSPADIKTTQEVLDVLLEICNIIGGNLKSRLCDAGFLCRISTPSVVDNTIFKPSSQNWVLSESYMFQYEEHCFFIRGYLA